MVSIMDDLKIATTTYNIMTSQGLVSDSVNNEEAAIYTGLAAQASESDSYPMQWHKRAIESGVVPNAAALRVMQEVSFAIKQARILELENV